MKKAIIFDMDGTLWDSADNVAISWNIAMEKFGYEREPINEADMQSVMGKTMDKIAEILFDKVEGEERKALLELACKEENDYLREHGGVLYPEIRKTMECLKEDYRLFIVSNCQAGYIEAFLDYYQFHDLVEDIECYGNNDKPKAENIQLICQRNGIAAEDAVYVGDIQGDYDSSMAAGVKFIHAAYGFGTIDAEVVKIDAFSDLPKVVKTIF
ncbi:MAG: HAD family hydrolase [Lachnospiraceae bacterium]|nr:HAD family hydrolase [Lachnospiraceae bacterium]